MISLAALAPYAKRARTAIRSGCDLCGAAIGEPHGHLVDVVERRLRCACGACRFLFERPGQRYRRVPDRYLRDPRFELDDARWSALQIPVRIAFLFRPSSFDAKPARREEGPAATATQYENAPPVPVNDRWVAFYPGPAGATESLLGLESWRDFAAACPLAAEVRADVEALLVAGDGRGRYRCFLVPIDACYELVGRVKRTWRGFDGGEEAWRAIEGFFNRVESRCESLPEPPA